MDFERTEEICANNVTVIYSAEFDSVTVSE